MTWKRRSYEVTFLGKTYNQYTHKTLNMLQEFWFNIINASVADGRYGSTCCDGSMCCHPWQRCTYLIFCKWWPFRVSSTKPLQRWNSILLRMETKGVFFNLKSSISQLALSASFEYICYGSTVIINMLFIAVRGSTLDVRIWRLWTSDSDI